MFFLKKQVTGKKLFSASHQIYEAVRSLWAKKEDGIKVGFLK